MAEDALAGENVETTQACGVPLFYICHYCVATENIDKMTSFAMYIASLLARQSFRGIRQYRPLYCLLCPQRGKTFAITCSQLLCSFLTSGKGYQKSGRVSLSSTLAALFNDHIPRP